MSSLPVIRWLVRSESSVPEGEGWLTHGERAVLGSLRLPRRRASWRLGRWTAKQALSLALAPDERRWELLASGDGAPEASAPGVPTSPSVSLSHGAGVGLCVVGPPGLPLGCDVEAIEPREPGFVEDWFTEAERRALEGSGGRPRDVGVTVTWSAKESALKALRVGLREDTRAVEVTLEGGLREGPGWRALRVEHVRTGRVFRGWWKSCARAVITVVGERGVGLPRALDPRWRWTG